MLTTVVFPGTLRSLEPDHPVERRMVDAAREVLGELGTSEAIVGSVLQRKSGPCRSGSLQGTPRLSRPSVMGPCERRRHRPILPQPRRICAGPHFAVRRSPVTVATTPIDLPNRRGRPGEELPSHDPRRPDPSVPPSSPRCSRPAASTGWRWRRPPGRSPGAGGRRLRVRAGHRRPSPRGGARRRGPSRRPRVAQGVRPLALVVLLVVTVAMGLAAFTGSITAGVPPLHIAVLALSCSRGWAAGRPGSGASDHRGPGPDRVHHLWPAPCEPRGQRSAWPPWSRSGPRIEILWLAIVRWPPPLRAEREAVARALDALASLALATPDTPTVPTGRPSIVPPGCSPRPPSSAGPTSPSCRRWPTRVGACASRCPGWRRATAPLRPRARPDRVGRVRPPAVRAAHERLSSALPRRRLTRHAPRPGP